MKKKIIIVIAIILALAAVIFSVFIITRNLGKKKLTQNEKTPELPKIEEVQEAEKPQENESEYSVKYKGKKYKYNENVINVLFIGVDTDKQSEAEAVHGVGGQADFLLLASINPDSKEIRVLSIPRDTVCDVVVHDYQGEVTTTKRLPISLSHAYGDGGVKSAELTVNAVSELLYGLPIHAWYSLNVDSIRIINDAVGGVKITVDESNIQYLSKDAVMGEEYILKGNYARRFVVHRYNEDDSTRRIRQKVYLSSFVKQAKKAFSDNPLIVVDIYKKISDYSLTSLTLDEVVWLAGEVATMDINSDFASLKGEYVQGETMKEYVIDEVFLYEMMLDLFYVEVE